MKELFDAIQTNDYNRFIKLLENFDGDIDQHYQYKPDHFNYVSKIERLNENIDELQSNVVYAMTLGILRQPWSAR